MGDVVVVLFHSLGSLVLKVVAKGVVCLVHLGLPVLEDVVRAGRCASSDSFFVNRIVEAEAWDQHMFGGDGSVLPRDSQLLGRVCLFEVDARGL